MDFELTEEQRAFAETARDFARAELAPFAAQWDAESSFPREAIRKAGELGFCGLYAPESAGGLALPRLDATLVMAPSGQSGFLAHPDGKGFAFVGDEGAKRA